MLLCQVTATSGRRTQEAQEIPRGERGARDVEGKGNSGPCGKWSTRGSFWSTPADPRNNIQKSAILGTVMTFSLPGLSSGGQG